MSVDRIDRQQATDSAAGPSTGRVNAGTGSLLERRLRAAAERRLAAGIPRVEPGCEMPLTGSQQRLWFLHQLAPAAASYNVSRTVVVDGVLDPGAVAAALRVVVGRHHALRTTFHGGTDGPRQVIGDDARVRLLIVDVIGLPAPCRDAWAKRLCEAEARRPFDLVRGPLLRARLFRLRADRHLLQLTFHHLVIDGGSIGILFRELEAAYRAARERRPVRLPGLPVRFADFASWQRGRSTEADLERLLAYWREHLRGAEDAMRARLGDRTPPPRPANRGARVRRRLPQGLRCRLVELGRREEVTPFMTLLAGFQLLLGRYGSTDDVVVGFPISGRDRREVEGLIGFFVDTLVLRTRLDGDPPFRELLARVKEGVLGAFAHREMPLDRLVEAICPDRSATRNPLFQVMFVHQGAAPRPPELPGARSRVEEVETGASSFDLTLSVEEQGDEVTACLQYDSELFDRTTAVRLLGHLETLLEAAAAAPQAPLSRLPMLRPAELHALRAEWNDVAGDYDPGTSVSALFARQAARSPDAVAVACGDLQLTYRALAERSQRLAARLRSRGLAAGDRVAVYLERSVDLVVALLGTLQAGGAYVPLEVGSPAERLRSIVGDCRPAWLIGAERLAADHPALAPGSGDLAGMEPVALAAATSEGGAAAADRRVAVGGDDLAYVMYTSGSTGRPKGVAVPHRAIVRLVQDPSFVELSAREVFLQFAPVAFDASTLEVWAPLLHGGRLVIVEPGPVSIDELGETIRRHGVTSLWLTAGVFHQVVESRPRALAGVRQLLAGGDVLSVSHVRRAIGELGCRVINGYGPTENTTFTSCHTVRERDLGRSVPIGRPIAGTRCHVLDRFLRPAPIGVPGELYAAGDGLALGYLGRSAATAASFLPDPFGAPGSRLYRTGDRVRWTSSGVLEFLGRRDRQVKLRGFRIEPGEIESVLAAHPGVESCAVVLEGEGDHRRLVAFVASSSAPTSALRTHLEERLPSYMLPGAWVVLDRLPLNANGKVDRRALEALPERHRNEAESVGRIAPRTRSEKVVAEIWEEVLARREIGVTEDFFALGGHSLLAIKIVARIGERLGVSVPLRRLFEAPTVEGLARTVDQAGSRQAAAGGMALAAGRARVHEEPRGDAPLTGTLAIPDHLRSLLES